MTTIIVLGVIFVWLLVSAVVVVSATMMSSRISEMEEGQVETQETNWAPAPTPVKSTRIPTQPRARVAR